MNTPSSAPSAPSAPRLVAFTYGNARRGALVGLVPLALLLVGIAATLLVSTLTLGLIEPAPFATRQATMVVIAGAGLLVSAIIYAVACVRVLRHVTQWRRAGEARQATAALWALACAALVVLSPMVIAAFAPYSAP